MKPHPKIRKTIKWGGAVVTVLLVVVWIGSAINDMTWLRADGHFFAVTRGVFMYQDWSHILQLVGKSDFTFLGLPAGPFEWWGMLERSSRGRGWIVYVPIWIPALMTLVSSGIAWRLDTLARRRARLNHCPKCNYDRTGIAAGAVCPECGTSP